QRWGQNVTDHVNIPSKDNNRRCDGYRRGGLPPPMRSSAQAIGNEFLDTVFRKAYKFPPSFLMPGWRNW
ncbi:MAG: hypothetical protein ABIF87_01240, partial [Pseudomonadota bacterium]